MRQRVIDGALLAGLVLVAFAIMWTLFTLGRDRPERATAPAPAPAPTAPAAGAGGAVEPLAPNRAPDPGSADAADAGTPSAPADLAGEAPDAPTTEDAATDAPDAPEAPREPLPPGAVPLERIGFSYVTGGPGACGVVLEPWKHVAVSRDILAELGCGAEVTVELDDPAGGRSRVQAVVGDTMNPVHARTVNVYVGTDEPALEYGVTAGTLTR